MNQSMESLVILGNVLQIVSKNSHEHSQEIPTDILLKDVFPRNNQSYSYKFPIIFLKHSQKFPVIFLKIPRNSQSYS